MAHYYEYCAAYGGVPFFWNRVSSTACFIGTSQIAGVANRSAPTATSPAGRLVNPFSSHTTSPGDSQPVPMAYIDVSLTLSEPSSSALTDAVAPLGRSHQARHPSGSAPYFA